MRALMFMFLSVLTSLPISAGSIWVEGEDATVRKSKGHSWYDSVKKDVLSAGAWISHFDGTAPGEVGYQIDVPAAGSYTFWIRANPLRSTLSYKLDGGNWTAINMGNPRGQINIAADNKPDLRFLAWIKVGKIKLAAGKHSLGFKFSGKLSNHGAIDCFCLTTERWVPSGAMKPGAPTGAVTEKPVGPDKAIWIEGEDASKSSVTRNPWYHGVKMDVLSGGQMISHFDGKKAGSATYTFDVEVAGNYTFWFRGNPLRSKISYSIDGTDAKAINWGDGKREQMNIASNNKPDMRFIAWVRVGKLDLAKGAHKISFTIERGDAKIPHHGSIDCFAFVRVPWIPSGSKRPSVRESGSAKPDSWFPVVADDDEFSNESIIDMSRLVDAPAGKHGFLKADGKDLRFEKATKPVKFWAVGSNRSSRDTPAQMLQAAKWFRKHGINLVRQHTVVGDVGFLNANGQFDKTRIDRFDRWFATLKKEGIYMTWSVIYPHHGPLLRKSDGLAADRYAEIAKGAKGRHGAVVTNDYINIDRDIQDIVLRIFTALLNHKNPYTGLQYKDDPALAVLEFQNESNIFFHTINNMRAGKAPVYAKRLRKGFFQFIKRKYKTKDGVAKAWNNKWDRDDKWAQGELGIMAAYHWGAEGPLYEYAGQLRRCGDFIEYLTELQRGYYVRREKEVRQLGFRGVTVTTAWKGIGSSSLANLYCDTAADMIDRHNYFGGGDGGHRIVEGKVSTGTHLNQPGRGLMNLGLFQVADRPFGISEWSMMPPAAYKAEAAPLFAFYGLGLQGWDASYHFACGTSRMGDGWPGLGKYSTQTPHYMGQFPALTFAIYNNHIKEGDVIAARHVKQKQLFTGRDELGQSIGGGSHDLKVLGKNVKTPPEAIAVGRVTLAFDDKDSVQEKLSTYWDKNKKVINSTTGQLRWNYGDRYFEVRSKKTQAVVGFAGGKALQLPSVTLNIKTPFVSVIFTPLDNLDLEQSKHILVTAMARDKQTGSKFSADWSKLITIGGPPLLMEPVQAKIKLAGAAPKSIKAVDIYGVPTERTAKVEDDGSFTIDGTHQTYYYEIKR